MNDKIPELYCDPFDERSVAGMHRDIHLLGARVRFDSNSEDLLRLVDLAYAGLPRHKLARVEPRLRVRLVLTSPERKRAGVEPAPLRMTSGAGLRRPRGRGGLRGGRGRGRLGRRLRQGAAWEEAAAGGGLG